MSGILNLPVKPRLTPGGLGVYVDVQSLAPTVTQWHGEYGHTTEFCQMGPFKLFGYLNDSNGACLLRRVTSKSGKIRPPTHGLSQLVTGPLTLAALGTGQLSQPLVQQDLCEHLRENRSP